MTLIMCVDSYLHVRTSTHTLTTLSKYDLSIGRDQHNWTWLTHMLRQHASYEKDHFHVFTWICQINNFYFQMSALYTFFSACLSWTLQGASSLYVFVAMVCAWAASAFAAASSQRYSSLTMGTHLQRATVRSAPSLPVRLTHTQCLRPLDLSALFAILHLMGDIPSTNLSS